jgi:hypothetical protein
MALIPIRYRDFYDVPRAFVVQRAGSLHFFDCPFDDRIDEYPDRYTVYRLDATLSPALDVGSWESLANKGERIGEVPTQCVQFDPTRRAAIDDSIFALIEERR